MRASLAILIPWAAIIGCGRRTPPVPSSEKLGALTQARMGIGATDTATRIESPATLDSVWYRGVRLIDLTGDGRPDSVILTAIGRRSGSLRLALAFVVEGRGAYQSIWPSSAEFVYPELSDTTTATRDNYLRSALDSILSGVRVEPLDSADIVMRNGDSVFATHHFTDREVLFSHAEEFTVGLVWDTGTKGLVEVYGCC